jgi:hypothetical protein
MALISPGVEVQVIDESFYTPAEPGTVPLIVVATAENKLNGAGTGTASGTTAANAGKVFKVTSQRELVETYGSPFFEKTASASPVHGGERNEYGLLAAYSLLGVSNSAFILRADINLNELEGQTAAPGAEPADGKWWVDTQTTTFGINEWNSSSLANGGQKFTAKTPIVLTDDDFENILSNAPKTSVGTIGDYAVVIQTAAGDGTFLAEDELVRMYYKSAGNATAGITAGTWVLVGSSDWAASHPTANSAAAVSAVSGTLIINDVSITPGVTLASCVSDINTKMNGSGITAVASNNRLYLYSDGTSTATGGDSTAVDGGTGGIVISGTALAASGANDAAILASPLKIAAGTYMCPVLAQQPHTSVPLFKKSDFGSTVNARPTGSVWIKTTEPNNGARWRVKRYNASTGAWVANEAPLYANPQSALYFLDRSGGGTNLPKDALFVQTNAREDVGSYSATTGAVGTFDALDESLATATFRLWKRAASGATAIRSKIISSGTITVSTAGVLATALVVGTYYIIQSLGNTNWNTVAGTSGVTYAVGDTIVPTTVGTGTGTAYVAKTFTIRQSIVGDTNLSAAVTIAFAAIDGDDSFRIAGAINAANYVDSTGAAVTNNVVASVTTSNELVITHKTGGDIRLTDVVGTSISTLFTVYNLETGAGTANFYNLSDTGGLTTGAADKYLASLWIPLVGDVFSAKGDAPLDTPADGQLWYNPSFGDVDLMIHNGTTWVGYQNFTGFTGTDPEGPIVSASMPELQSDGTTLVTGDIWISTADLENFPTIYKYNTDAGTKVADKWVLVDKTDQTTEEGILFADARAGTSGGTATAAPTGTIKQLLTSNFLDFDAPDPDLYPKGMLLWNLRAGGGNVKKYRVGYIDTTADNVRMADVSMELYWPDRWTTASPNNEDGSGSFGRKAQRSAVVAALKSVIDTSEEARDEERRNFNLIACPGYPEALSNLINLNLDRKVTSFVVGDTPLRLKSDATSLTTWGTNANLALDNGDNGIVTYDEYAAVWYPNGFTTDLTGANAVVPASHMMLRTIALSDQVSYPWFAPAGTRRGGITNATAVGYIDPLTSEFQSVALNNGQRDTLYDLKVNPIPFFVGTGLVAYGQKTRARNASSLDRINVARLVVYLRSQLTKLARPYIFEPNDQITRDEIKQAVESLLLELVGLRAVYDFAVVCDESNNTPSRIDRNELYVDVAIEPTKAVEFIYIPLRLKNTGEI